MPTATPQLAEVLLAAAARGPERFACVGPDSVTYGDLERRVAATAADVREAARPGDRVALIAGNEVAFLVAYLAILRAGCVAALLNVTSPAHELAGELDTVAPRLVLASPPYEDLASRAAAHAAPPVPVVVVDPSHVTDPDAVPCLPREPDDLAVLMFTAGTGGAPKPAMLTHGSLIANLEQMQSHPGLHVTADDVALGVLPLFHIYGLNVVAGLALRAGAAVSLVEHFHPAESVGRVRADGVTVIAAVPSIFDAWLALDADTAPADAFARVRLCVSGAAALAPATVRRMNERFGLRVHNGYGLTEASPAVTTTAVEAELRPDSIGPPLPGVEVRLVDVDGKDALAGDPGEIWVRGANVFAGYWNDATASEAALAGGWLHTGDIAVADDDGWLTLVDRAKDIIIVSGFNVYPAEVEAVLRTHPAVAEAAVVGEPHPRTGEAVTAYVVPRGERALDPVELVRYGARRLARYKLPTRVEVLDELPRTLAGKVLRRALSSEETSTARTRRPPDATTNPA